MPTVDPRKEEPESLLVRVCSFVGVMGLAFLIGGFGAALRPYFRQPDEYESSRDYNEERDRLRLQVLRNLIDETLQIQEAKAAEVSVNQNEVDEAFARVAANFKMSPAQFAAFIKSKGSSASSLKRQIRGEMSWQPSCSRPNATSRRCQRSYMARGKYSHAGVRSAVY